MYCNKNTEQIVFAIGHHLFGIERGSVINKKYYLRFVQSGKYDCH